MTTLEGLSPPVPFVLGWTCVAFDALGPNGTTNLDWTVETSTRITCVLAGLAPASTILESIRVMGRQALIVDRPLQHFSCPLTWAELVNDPSKRTPIDCELLPVAVSRLEPVLGKTVLPLDTLQPANVFSARIRGPFSWFAVSGQRLLPHRVLGRWTPRDGDE